MTQYDLGQVVGSDGEDGNGIKSIAKTGTSGLVDTYTITFDDDSTTTFQVTNGSDASVTIVTSWNSTTSDAKVPSEKLAKTSLDGKVDKVTGKGLSTNDFTNGYKSTIDGLSTVATSGSYSDLSNKPSIPSSSSDLSDGSSLVKTSSTTGLLKNDGSVDTNSYLTTGSASSTYQTKLVSGTSIKTINNESLLGSGNISIQGGSSVDVVTSWEATLSDTKVPSEKLTKDSLDGKANSTHNHGYIYNDGKVDSNFPLDSDYDIYMGVLGVFGSMTDFEYCKIIPTSLNIPNTVIRWSSTPRDYNVPSEKLTKDTLDTKIAKSSTSGLVKNDGTIDTSAYITSSAISGMLTSSDIANNLTTTTTGKVLDASQGKALADLIGNAITYINQ